MELPKLLNWQMCSCSSGWAKDYLGRTWRCKTNNDGWKSTNDLVNHIKDIQEVKDNQQLSDHDVRCRGAAARAGSVHLIICTQMTRSWAGGRDRTHPQQHHPAPHRGQFSKKFWPTTSPPEVHKQHQWYSNAWTTPKGTQWHQWHSPPQPHNPLHN